MPKDETLAVEETIHKIIARAIRSNDFILTPSSTFKELGADSLDVVQIMVAIEEAFGVDLEDKDLKAITNMGEFIDYVEKKVIESRYICQKI